MPQASMKDVSSDGAKGASALVQTCANLSEGERALVIANSPTLDVAELVKLAALRITEHVDLIVEPVARMHGGEPTAETAEKMLEADVIFCLTQKSLAHSQARLNATNLRSRYLSLADYSMEQLESAALLFDFRTIVTQAERLATSMDGAERISVSSIGGTQIDFSVVGRDANRAPGVVSRRGDLGSPPDAEVNIAPIEGTASGKVVVDGSIPCDQIGLLAEPVILWVEEGCIREMEGCASAVDALEKLFSEAGPKSRVLAEFGIGLNPLAKLCGRMLEDEGCGGTIHFGFGSNATIGGTNSIGFHLDFIVKQPTIQLDGRLLLVDK